MVYHASSAVICRDLSVYEDVARTWIIIIAEAYTEAVLTPAEWSDASVQAEQRLEVHSGKACLWMDVHADDTCTLLVDPDLRKFDCAKKVQARSTTHTLQS